MTHSSGSRCVSATPGAGIEDEPALEGADTFGPSALPIFRSVELDCFEGPVLNGEAVRWISGTERPLGPAALGF